MFPGDRLKSLENKKGEKNIKNPKKGRDKQCKINKKI